MKQFLLVVLALACGAVLIMGNLYWQDRTDQTTKDSKVESTPVSVKAPKDTEDKNEKKKKKT
ncbi:hypothetical protein ACPJHQ_23105 [Rossellomorea sp. H39__3]